MRQVIPGQVLESDASEQQYRERNENIICHQFGISCMSSGDSRTAVVTGSANGIGKAIVADLVEVGFVVVGIDVVTVTEGIATYQFTADVSNEEEVSATFAEIAGVTESVDLLVNNAGVLIPGSLENMHLRDFDRQFAVNVRGVFLMTQQVLPYMGSGGRIINMASELAYVGRAYASAYCGSKGAVLAMTRAWARELAPLILVNAVAPGPVNTGLLNFPDMTPEQQALESANPLGRIGTPREVAGVVRFLAGETSTFITGQCFSVDGGAAMH